MTDERYRNVENSCSYIFKYTNYLIKRAIILHREHTSDDPRHKGTSRTITIRNWASSSSHFHFWHCLLHLTSTFLSFFLANSLGTQLRFCLLHLLLLGLLPLQGILPSILELLVCLLGSLDPSCISFGACLKAGIVGVCVANE